MKWLLFLANSRRTFKTERGSVGGSGRAYNLSRQICIVSSRGTFVKNELTSNEHMISLLWLNVLAQSVVVSVYRRNNRTKRTTRFMNLRKAIEDARGRTTG